MFRQVHYTEPIPIPTTALISPTAHHMHRILQAFVQRKRLFQYHEKLHGVVVNVQVDCMNDSSQSSLSGPTSLPGTCAHQRHVWPVVPDSFYVQIPTSYHANVLSMKPGDRLSAVVKKTCPLGLIFTASDHDVDFLVYKDDGKPNKPGVEFTVEPRPIPDSLWRPGSFAMLVFEGVSATDGPYASIDPTYAEPAELPQAPELMLTDARELLFELDAMMASSSSSSSSQSSPTKKKSAARTKVKDKKNST